MATIFFLRIFQKQTTRTQIPLARPCSFFRRFWMSPIIVLCRAQLAMTNRSSRPKAQLKWPRPTDQCGEFTGCPSPFLLVFMVPVDNGHSASCYFSYLPHEEVLITDSVFIDFLLLLFILLSRKFHGYLANLTTRFFVESFDRNPAVQNNGV